MLQHDMWSKWLLESRFGDRGNKEPALDRLKELRDKVLANAELRGGETVLDVGAGDGLIAFGALEHLGPSGKVILADVSQPLLEEARSIAERLGDGLLQRCQFLQASAEDLSLLADDTVDVVTTRSVLIYVKDKLRALKEFHRVLKPGGRISLFETVSLPDLRPRNEKWPGVGMLTYPAEALAPISDLVARFVAGLDFSATKSMSDANHINYLQLCENTGFKSASVELHLKTQKGSADLQSLLHQSLNPHFPTPAEHMEKIFTDAERERFLTHMQKLMQSDAGVSRSSAVFVCAVKE